MASGLESWPSAVHSRAWDLPEAQRLDQGELREPVAGMLEHFEGLCL